MLGVLCNEQSWISTKKSYGECSQGSQNQFHQLRFHHAFFSPPGHIKLLKVNILWFRSMTKKPKQNAIPKFEINRGQNDLLNCTIYDLLNDTVNDLVSFKWSFLSPRVILDWDMKHESEEITFGLINIDLLSVRDWCSILTSLALLRAFLL